MNWKLIAQMALAAIQIISIVEMIKLDFRGRPARTPTRWKGAIGSLIATAIGTLIYWLAGMYSEFTIK